MQGERVRVAEVEPRQALRDDDRVSAVRCEVHVVRVVDRDRLSRCSGPRIDRRDAVADVVEDVERLQIPRRRDVLGKPADRELAHDPEGAGVDLVDGVAEAVGHVDERPRASRYGAQHSGRVVRIDVLDRLARDAVRTLHARRRRRPRGELFQGVDRAAGTAPAGDRDPPVQSDRGEIAAREAQASCVDDLPPLGVDSDDVRARRVHGGAAPADHVRDLAQRRRCGMRRRVRQGSDVRQRPRARIEGVDAPRCRSGRRRAAGDHELVRVGGDGRVPQRGRQVRDDARLRSRAPRENRVEPPRARVAADDVRRAADRGCGEIGTSDRKRADARHGVRYRVDAQNGRELRGSVPAAEEIRRAAEPNGGGVMEDAGKPSADDVGQAGDDAHPVRGGIGGVETSEQHEPATTERGGGSVLQRRCERARDDRCEANRPVDELHGVPLRLSRPGVLGPVRSRLAAGAGDDQQEREQGGAAAHRPRMPTASARRRINRRATRAFTHRRRGAAVRTRRTSRGRSLQPSRA